VKNASQIFFKIGDANFVATNVKKIQNKDEKHLPWILCRGLGMFLKQLDQFMLQYYSFKAENIAKQQKCWQYAWRHRWQLGLDCDVRKFLSSYFTIHGFTIVTYNRNWCIYIVILRACSYGPCKVIPVSVQTFRQVYKRDLALVWK
jgi:hypothetical protein